ncbi:2-dehydro-3-deoxygalactonokinase [Ruegeria sp. 2205SS24-7]|uniref:2-dehydro-3-deoxygalactonokinase n=1 Tax=Ruegeria discodermiae TaxID=3064389 RepID=UPI002742941B|nr:2-dehydro-3-deoxygalactonokinase [Ruegeria sp. 2205SS24-7]MDP5220193.1 2-dehydro-3-deoxygalactonokinase [Ruegeria sp. 2205SS24-7]
MSHPSFIAVDWGTSGFRLWVLDACGKTLAETDGPFGMSNLEPSDFGRVLEENLNELGIGQDVPAIICGMAGAAQGWCEAPYLTAPTRLDKLGAGAIRVSDASREVRILPGVKQQSPANVMRGEETQIAGLLHLVPDFRGIVCLPGTHTKWVRVADGAIIEFETCMTGEQFAFFSRASVLSHSMVNHGWSDSAFEAAIRLAADDPAALPRRLFAIRAGMLVGKQTSAQARATLSGLLIGQELMSVRQYWTDQTVTLIGASTLCELYLTALGFMGASGRVTEVSEITLSGLTAAYQHQRRCFSS